MSPTAADAVQLLKGRDLGAHHALADDGTVAATGTITEREQPNSEASRASEASGEMHPYRRAGTGAR
jgi:hypothetical protein